MDTANQTPMSNGGDMPTGQPAAMPPAQPMPAPMPGGQTPAGTGTDTPMQPMPEAPAK